MGVIALLTDFGLDDPYVGQMKGVIAGQSPGLSVVDLSHGVRPHAVMQASFFLRASMPHFPQGTVFVAVVDPEVGTERRILCAVMGGSYVLAPDNGLLTMLEPDRLHDCSSAAQSYPASCTFHGRDVFAPLAVRLAKGERPESLGPPIALDQAVPGNWAHPHYKPLAVHARVLHVDRFGNCVLNIPVDSFERCQSVVRAGTSRNARGVRAAYAYGELKGGEVGLLAGSQGFLELAMNQKSAAAEMFLEIGSSVLLELGEEA